MPASRASCSSGASSVIKWPSSAQMEDASSSSSSDDDKRRKKEKKKRKREKKKRKKARKRAKKAAKRRDASDDDDDEYGGWAAVDAAQRRRADDADAAWRDKLFGACAEDDNGEDPFGSGWGDAEDGSGDWFEHVSRQRSRARDREAAERARAAQAAADAERRRRPPPLPPTPPREARPPTPPPAPPQVESLYEVLGVERNATDRDLRTAYRRLALEHHPDQGGCEETMARLNHARDVLCDPVARRNHDRELDNL